MTDTTQTATLLRLNAYGFRCPPERPHGSQRKDQAGVRRLLPPARAGVLFQVADAMIAARERNRC